VAGGERVQRPDRVHVDAAVGEEGARAAVDSPAIDEQRLAVTEGIS
jgi:hypothetical protein